MKAQERHRLKENAFASNTVRVIESMTEYRDRWIMGGAAVVLLIAAVGGFTLWRQHASETGGAMLGIALAIEQAQIAPAPTVPGARQTPGTYPTEQARNEAALQAFQQVAAAYGSSNAGLTAQYHIGVAQLAMGHFTEARQAFEQTAARAGSSVYGPMARMGRAEVMLAAGQYEDAIKAFTELSAERDGLLPIDGVLMQLGKSCAKAGKTQEAKATFKRIVDEFPDSPYVTDAKTQLTLLG
jgi:TolA-binding protein